MDRLEKCWLPLAVCAVILAAAFYSVILGQTIRRAFSFRHTAMQPVCMDRGYCSFGFHEKMGGYFQHIDKMDGSEIMGTLFIPLPFHCDDSILSDHVYKIAGSASLSFVAAAGFCRCISELMRSSAVFRCSGGSSVELEERKIMFAENLIQLRKLNHMSQDELADQIGVSRQTLSKYETGESLPDIERCKRLADVFGVTVDDLINYEKKDSLGLEVPPKENTFSAW